MKRIEFVGMARAGKTTTAEALKAKYSEIEFHPERHDLVPEKIKSDLYKYAIWYAEYCVNIFNESLSTNKVHIFERGIIDHVVMGNVYYKKGWFTDIQYKKYNSILKPYISRIDTVVVFLIPVIESVKRAKIMGKDVTKAIPYMEALYKEYKNLPTWCSSVKYLPEESSLGELFDLTENIVK